MPKSKDHKDLAYPTFMEKVYGSWTYARLSDQEKLTVEKLLKDAPIKGNFQSRYDQLVYIYNAFLYGAGYIDYC